MILYVLCNSELDLPSKTAKVRPFTKINIPTNIRTMQLNSSDCISPIEINRQNTEEAAPLLQLGLPYNANWTTIFHQICI